MFAEADDMRRYWNDPEQTARVMQPDEEGRIWMHTGDEGIMDEEGYLRSKGDCFVLRGLYSNCCSSVVGRIKDIIIRGGEVCCPKCPRPTVRSLLARISSRCRLRTS